LNKKTKNGNTENEFESEFCNVRYIQKDNIVFLVWKKFCCYENYRTPTIFSLELLKKYSNCNFGIDARNGFEEEMDMWTKEFRKYFNVKKVNCYEDIAKIL
jgi:hypothetical protein